MNKLIIYFAVMLSSCSTQKLHQEPKLVTKPILYPEKNYLNKFYDEPFFKEEHCGLVTNNQTKDTIRRNYTSETTIVEDTLRRFLRNCKIELLAKGQLSFELTDTPFSAGLNQLNFVKSTGKLDATFQQTFSITDTSYKKPVFKIIKKAVFLDKEKYAKGELVKGKFLFQISAKYFWENEHSDTISVYGFIKATVQ